MKYGQVRCNSHNYSPSGCWSSTAILQKLQPACVTQKYSLTSSLPRRTFPLVALESNVQVHLGFFCLFFCSFFVHLLTQIQRRPRWEAEQQLERCRSRLGSEERRKDGAESWIWKQLWIKWKLWRIEQLKKNQTKIGSFSPGSSTCNHIRFASPDVTSYTEWFPW